MGQLISSPLYAARACGILLSPGYSYGKTKTSLFATEFAVLTGLSNSGCQCDYGFRLLFDVKSKVVTGLKFANLIVNLSFVFVCLLKMVLVILLLGINQ